MLKLPGQLCWTWLTLVVLIFDQITKHWIEAVFRVGEVVPVMPSFNLTLAYNPGAAFSFLADQPGWQRWFFTLISMVVSVLIVRWLAKMAPAERWSAVGLALILGGAIGNLIDRMLLGHVIDFIQVYYEPYYWPSFNVADSAITCGAIIMILFSFLGSDAAEEAANPESKT